ncbi:hypothetical protein [Tepidimonas sp.]|uniref:hypothetical protein n=1 Tax=Tepidimonas sp. TaxID=2002775 RepID=UPI00391A77C1
MRKNKIIRTLFACVATSLLTACGGGGDGDAGPQVFPAQGLWSNQYGGVLVTSSGEFWGLEYAGSSACEWILYQGQASASGSSVSGSGSAYCGTAKVNGTISGSFTSTSMTVTLSASGLGSQTVSLARQSIYDQTPSLTQFAGSYRSDGGAVFVVTSSGGISGYNGSCSFTGTARPSDDGKNYFRFGITYGAGCGVLAGRSSSGIAVPADSRTVFYGEKLTDGSLGQAGVLTRF